MPNYISNILTLSGNSDNINQIMGSNFSFGNLIPLNPKRNRKWFENNCGTYNNRFELLSTYLSNLKQLIEDNPELAEELEGKIKAILSKVELPTEAPSEDANA